MAYALGVDIGTTFSAAAVAEGGRVEMFTLGTVGSSIPSVVVLRADGEVLVGEAAERRAITEPARTAREFKRRLGDPAPLVLGGTPYGAEALMARVLQHIVRAATERQGGPPARITVTHPANYGPYKKDLLAEMVRLSDVGAVDFITEPEAAAINYSEQDRLAVGAVLAVYDFGGGTFDAAVLRKTADGFEILGQPEGMDRLGGIDFDQAVFAHVNDATGGQLSELDMKDPSARAAVARLRADVRSAKEALSSDTEVTIPVILPTLHTEVRLTRAEFEGMIRPRVEETITALQRALRSAGVPLEQVAKILLVGGSSRIPLVADMVRSTTGRPVVTDAHPKFAIALGAARQAARQLVAPDMEKTAPVPVVPAAAAARPAAAPAVPVPPSVAPPREAAPSRSRSPLPFVLAGVVLLALAAVAVFALMGGGLGGTAGSASPSASTGLIGGVASGSPSAPESGATASGSTASATGAPQTSTSPSGSAPESRPGIGELFAGAAERGDSGDGGPATDARFGIIGGLARLPDGSFVLNDDTGAIRLITPDGIVSRPASQPELTGALAAEPGGSVVIIARFPSQVWRMTPDGALTRIAGREDGASGFAGDGGPADLAELYNPDGIAVAPDGSIYVSDSQNNRIRHLHTDGTIETAAGNGEQAFRGDGGPASEAALAYPAGLAIAADGTLYFVDVSNYRIRQIDPGGTITTVLGSGDDSPEEFVEGGEALLQGLDNPRVVGLDPAGNLYTFVLGRVVRLEDDGTLTSVAGGGSDLNATNVVASELRLDNVSALVFDPENGDLYIADSTRILRVPAVGEVDSTASPPESTAPPGSTAPATGEPPSSVPPFGAAPTSRPGIGELFAGSPESGDAGDGGAALDARFSNIGGLAWMPDRSLVLTDATGAIRRIGPDGIVSRPASQPELVGAVAAAPDGSVAIVAPFLNQVWQMAPDGSLTRLAGREDGSAGFAGEGGPADVAQLWGPEGVAVAADGTTYVSDGSNDRIRRVIPGGTITSIAGNGERGFTGDGGPAGEARLAHPSGLALAEDGTGYFVDASNYRIRRIDPDGTISTVIGSGDDSPAEFVEGGDALLQGLNAPEIVGLDPAGNLYTYVLGHVVRLEDDGTLTSVAGGGDDLSATNVIPSELRLDNVSGIVFDPENGDLYIADNTRILRVFGVGEIE